MRVPVSWLRELVDVGASAEEVGEQLAFSGTGLDAIHHVGHDVSGIVTAKVLEVAEVPVSDKLVVARVDAGPAGVFQVVAGARNFRAGDVVPWAAPGARVTTLDVPIGIRRMPGDLESHGMLCSARELGLGEDHSGILVMDPAVPVGADVVELLGLRDEILDLNVTANRPDLLSVFGIAREVAVLFDAELMPVMSGVAEEGGDVSGLAAVHVEAPDACPRYVARVVEDVAWGSSPIAVQSRLSACGMRPLGNLVDATNYVLLLTGQPLHAFDLDRLEGHRIVVRWASEGERIVTLDGADRHLDRRDLVIADGARAQAIAGVMGGAEAEVGDTTRRVVIESAHFDPLTIARTSNRLRLKTEASHRFERGTDPGIAPGAAATCAELMRLWASGTIARGELDTGELPERPTVRLRRSRIETVLGTDVPSDEADRLLTGLGCEVRGRGDEVEVSVPSWRVDLEREIDLIEEVARLHGYDRIPSRVPRGLRGYLSREQVLRRRVRDCLLGAGLTEATLPSFVPDDDVQAALGGSDYLEVSNPMTAGQSILRPSLIPGLMRALQRNSARGSRDARLFETGTVFAGWPAGAELPEERTHVAVALSGTVEHASWDQHSWPVDALDAKGLAGHVLEELGIRSFELGPCDWLPFHPGRSATVMLDGAVAGRFGEVRPSVRRAFDLEGPVAVAELDVGVLLAVAPTSLQVTDVPRLPSVRRDIALFVDEEVPAGEVQRVIALASGPNLESVALFDVYRGEHAPPGRKSLAFRLTLRAPDRTLTDEEADAARENAAAAVRDRLGGETR
ncbi:MAG TPA: phenylalanine--tRNA ligase subunit beta [Actinomycetota bacterium]|nr:phenylalanine--tRNA ligase subunit beta [Actinomycetota bacterium]